MARRSVGRTLVRSVKRSTFWEGGSTQFSIPTASVAVATVVTEAELENIPNPTLIRIHGSVLISVTARTAAADSAVISMGMILQSAAAVTAGVGSMPLPFTDIGSAWIWHRQVLVRSLIAPPNGTDLAGNVRITIDNKAMRKVNPNQALVMIVQNTVQTGTITVSISSAQRLLFKK